LAAREHDRLAAESAEAWLLTLRERVSEIEGDTPKAYQKRRELVRLLVEQITTSRDEEGRTRVEVRYRFGPPADGEEDGLSTVYGASKGSPMRTSMNPFLPRSSASSGVVIPGRGSRATLSTPAG
jgi:hypothetical protein